MPLMLPVAGPAVELTVATVVSARFGIATLIILYEVFPVTPKKTREPLTTIPPVGYQDAGREFGGGGGSVPLRRPSTKTTTGPPPFGIILIELPQLHPALTGSSITSSQ